MSRMLYGKVCVVKDSGDKSILIAPFNTDLIVTKSSMIYMESVHSFLFCNNLMLSLIVSSLLPIKTISAPRFVRVRATMF